jgi:hypothetical protein
MCAGRRPVVPVLPAIKYLLAAKGKSITWIAETISTSACGNANVLQEFGHAAFRKPCIDA